MIWTPATHVGIFPACMYEHSAYAWCLQRSDKDTESPETGVTVGERPCQCWEPNLGPLWERSGLLTTEPLLQPPHSLYFGGNLDRKEAD